jgi:hypothetical protein
VPAASVEAAGGADLLIAHVLWGKPVALSDQVQSKLGQAPTAAYFHGFLAAHQRVTLRGTL